MHLGNTVIAAALLFLTSGAAAQVRPVVESLAPANGDPAGGTVVTIRGKGFTAVIPAAGDLAPSCTPCPAAGPSVSFGEKPATELRSFTDTEIVVVTPPNAGGLFDVQIGQGAKRVVLSRAFQYGTNNFDRILVPIVADRVAGAAGSIWSSELTGRNDNDTGIYVSQFPRILNPFPVYGQARTTFRPELQNNGAAFLHHEHIGEESSLEPLAFHLRIRDVSRQEGRWGTAIPLITPADAFVARPMDLIDVPFEYWSRATLRIYDLDGEVGGSVPVYLFEDQSDRLLGSTVVHFRDGAYQDFPKVPGYVVLDLLSLVQETTVTNRVRVQVGQKHLPKRLWSMISVTDMQTQHVTIITPHK